MTVNFNEKKTHEHFNEFKCAMKSYTKRQN